MKKLIDINCSIHNRFDIKVFDAKTNELKLEAEAYNVVTDTFFDLLLNDTSYGVQYGGWFKEICVGSGTGTPSASDTDLFHREYSSNSWNFNDGLSNERRYEYNNGVFSVKASIIIPALTLVGVNITEVGVGGNFNGRQYINTHAMLKDLSGNQISILKTDTDVIQIIATVYAHILNNLEELFLPLYANNKQNNLILILLGAGISGESFAIYSCYTDPYKRFPRYRDKLFENLSNVPPINLTLIEGVSTKSIRMQPIGLGNQITSKLFICDKENRLIRCSYRINAEYWNIEDRYNSSSYFPEYDTYGSRFLQILLFDNSSIHLNYKQFFTPLLIIKEAIGTGDGTTLFFATKFPCANLNGQVYINNNLSSGYFVDYEPYACSLRGNGYFHKLQDANSDIDYTGYFNYNTYYHYDSYWYDFDNQNYMLTYNYTKDTYVLDHNLNAILNITLPNNNFPYYTDALSGDENGNVKLSGILFNSSTILKLVIEGSNNLINWTTISNEITLSAVQRVQFLPYSYIRFKILECNASNGQLRIAGLDKEHGQIRNIFFPTPPAPGDIITATYTPDCIAKDNQHVFDIDITYNFNEYQGNQ